MPDWRNLVRQKTQDLRLTPAQKEEVTAELASHLEEFYDEQRALEVPEPEAERRSLDELSDWAELSRRIQSAKREEGIMNDRTKRLWLPGLASFWTALACELALGGSSIHGSLFHSHLSQFMYGLWLLGQLGCGALGAYLSRRAGGTRSARLGAALFTSGILLVTMLIVLAICAAGRVLGLGFAGLEFGILVKPVFMVIVIPSLAMLIGALPFLSDDRRAAIAS
ncbi:MAG TPA: hypothetical protein VEJ67_13380 [Candidatus Cybelea sp.]|nr:hypothetical protein [Candidatus Cybelea sp.]